MVPYLVFFAVACAVSLFTLGQKGKLLVDKFRQRRAASSNAGESEETLEEKLLANKMEIRKIYCVLLLGATEGARCDFRMFGAKPKSCSLSRPCVHECASGCAVRPVRCAAFARRFGPRSFVPICRLQPLAALFRSADVCTLALLPCSICRRVHPFGRCPSQAFE